LNSNKPPKKQDNSVYDAESIQVLKGLEGVRKRPSMYIGDTGDKGLHHLIFEIIDNSIDESLEGVCDKIDIIINDDNSIDIIDNGRGIPIGKHPEYDKYTPEVILEHLHAGGKFDNKSYKISGGLHGVGMSVVNALTEWLIVEIKREGKLYRQKFSKGLRVSDPEIQNLPENELDVTGTKISFYPDSEIFEFNPEDDIWDIKEISRRVRELAFLNPNATFTITSEIIEESIEYHFKGGLVDFVKFLNKDKSPLNENPIHFEKSLVYESDTGSKNIVIEVAIQYNKGYTTNIMSFANTINTTEGGTHKDGFNKGLSKAIRDYFEKVNSGKENEEKIKTEDTREGLTGIISLMLPEPQFESQTKIKLGNPEISTIVYQVVKKEMGTYLEENPTIASILMLKVKEAKIAREKAQRARELIRKSFSSDSFSLAGKLEDCTSKNPEICELFIVEGDSAGGSAIEGRNAETQAILPLRGKILNVEKSRIYKILNNNEIQSLISSIGVGVKGIDEESFDISKLRYDKIIIMCDADIDGAHIKTLLLTFFFRYMRPLIENGHIYVALPPLYKIGYQKSKNIGKTIYAYTDSEREKAVEKLIDEYDLSEEARNKITISRYKGLGEMDPEELAETTMDLNERTLLKVKIDDFIESDQTFSQLMGEEVSPRKKFITENYKYVKLLDI
jgi:DNA gyrase subunit B